jgi:TonB family protein
MAFVRIARRRCAPFVLLGFLWAAPGLAAPAPAAMRLPVEPAPDFPSGYEPDLIRSLLASPDSAEVSRACGNLRMPWGYRGWVGRQQSMRSYGRRIADATWTKRAIASLLDSAVVDTIYRAPSFVSSCRPAEGPPIYLVRVHRGGKATSVLLRFDLGVATVFADETPLGLIPVGARADSLWALLGEALEDDPSFRHARPAPGDSLFDRPHVTGEDVTTDSPPTAMGRGGGLPAFPPEAMRRGVQGTVHVLARVDAEGAVEDAIVHAGPELLREAALETAWRTRFKPARIAGKAVAAWTMLPITYRFD